MARVEQTVPASPERVYQVLADGWTYSDWVVGTVHIRDVDPDWPAPGSRIHHKAGLWPLWLKDQTVAVDHEPGSWLVLQPHLWPLGEMRVTITLTPIGDGLTKITMAEEFDEGPLRWARTKINDILLHWRNRESLRRLADLAVRRQPPPPAAPQLRPVALRLARVAPDPALIGCQ